MEATAGGGGGDDVGSGGSGAWSDGARPGGNRVCTTRRLLILCNWRCARPAGCSIHWLVPTPNPAYPTQRSQHSPRPAWRRHHTHVHTPHTTLIQLRIQICACVRTYVVVHCLSRIYYIYIHGTHINELYSVKHSIYVYTIADLTVTYVHYHY